MDISNIEKKLRNSSLGGIGFGIVALLICESPIIFATIGFGALHATTNKWALPFWLEAMSLSMALLGIVVLLCLAIRKMIRTTARNAIAENMKENLKEGI